MTKLKSDYLRKFIEYEHDLKLFGMKVQDVHFWHLIRNDVFFEITRQVFLLGDSNNEKLSKRNKVISLLKSLSSIIIHQPLLFLKQKDILVINHPRRVRGGDYFECIYTDPIISDIEISHYVFEYAENFTHKRPVLTSHLKYMDLITLLVALKKKFTLQKGRLSKNEEGNLRMLFSQLSVKFNISLEVDFWLTRVKNLVFEFELKSRYINFMLKRIQPRLILEVVHYHPDTMLINHLAKLQNIPTVELQHGTIDKTTLPYFLPENSMSSYLPDELWVFGQFWKDVTSFPLDDHQIKVVGFPYIERTFQDHKVLQSNSEKTTILFLAQWTIGGELSKLASDLSLRLDPQKFEIIYKLHPVEFSNWTDTYPELVKSDIKVVDDRDHDLYYYFTIADIQVGVYSTSIYEGLRFGLKTYIYKIFGYEQMIDLITEKAVKAFANLEELIPWLEGNDGDLDYEYYWSKNARANILTELSRHTHHDNNMFINESAE
jgi:hypothetical protein